MKLLGLIKLNSNIVVIDGLAIGSGRDDIEIGGLDNQVVRNPCNGAPYIPGSSVKGKMRFLAEWRLGRFNSSKGSVCDCNNEDCEVCRIFGTSQNEHKNGPTRLLVRDSQLKGEYDPEKQIEIKYSTAINRLTGTANNGSLRNMERVTPGTTFYFELVYRFFDTGDNGERDKKLFNVVKKCLKWLENDTLGGSGSRGCGKIAFREIVLSGLEQGEYPDTDALLANIPE